MNKSQQTYTKEQLNKIHEIEIEILTEVQRICEIGNISYFSLGGTTLGAVRHQGFIPWDDDIDIGMLREDYEKFLKLAKEQLGNNFALQHFSVDETTPFYFAKVRRNNTSFVEQYVKNLKINHGIFLDIFPFDKIPEDIQDRKKYFKRVSFYRQLFIAKSVTSACMERKLSKRIVCGFLRKILHLILIPVKKEYIYKKLDESLRCCNQTQSHTFSTYGLNHLNPLLEWLIPVKTAPFENTEICVPNDCHNVLKGQFGDYMTLPPAENRVGHCPYILDFEKQFTVD